MATQTKKAGAKTAARSNPKKRTTAKSVTAKKGNSKEVSDAIKVTEDRKESVFTPEKNAGLKANDITINEV